MVQSAIRPIHIVIYINNMQETSLGGTVDSLTPFREPPETSGPRCPNSLPNRPERGRSPPPQPSPARGEGWGGGRPDTLPGCVSQERRALSLPMMASKVGLIFSPTPAIAK